MELEHLRQFFLWGTVLTAAFLVLSLVIVGYASEWVYQIHSRWAPISREAFHIAIYCFLGAIKMVLFLFYLIPYLALRLMG